MNLTKCGSCGATTSVQCLDCADEWFLAGMVHRVDVMFSMIGKQVYAIDWNMAEDGPHLAYMAMRHHTKTLPERVATAVKQRPLVSDLLDRTVVSIKAPIGKKGRISKLEANRRIRRQTQKLLSGKTVAVEEDDQITDQANSEEDVPPRRNHDERRPYHLPTGGATRPLSLGPPGVATPKAGEDGRPALPSYNGPVAASSSNSQGRAPQPY